MDLIREPSVEHWYRVLEFLSSHEFVCVPVCLYVSQAGRFFGHVNTHSQLQRFYSVEDGHEG
jgi:hypothetical protein